MTKTVLTFFTISCLAATVLLVGFQITVKASPDLHVHNIDTGLDYATIQEAIDAPETLDEHTISVDEGIYFEHITVNKSIFLKGENKDTTIIDGNGTGTIVSIMTVSGVIIQDLTIRNYGTAVHIWDCSNITIFENNFISQGKSGWGVLITSDFNKLTKNTYIENEHGVHINGGTSNTISEEIYLNNSVGIEIMGATINSTISHSSFHSNTIGIRTSGQDGLIYHNNFINNSVHAAGFVSWNAFDNGYPSGGNYWGDYNGTDFFSGLYQNETGSDGIGDTQYLLLTYWPDNYPLMYQGGFIPIDVNQTLANYAFPLGGALNFTYTLNATMRVRISAQPFFWVGVGLYAKWDGTQPMLSDYDKFDYAGAGSESSLYSGIFLAPGTYYFMIHVVEHYPPWEYNTFDVKLTGYYPLPEFKRHFLDTIPNHVYFIYADPTYMIRPESAYDVASGNIIYGLCKRPQHQGFNTTKNWLLNTGAINTTTIHDTTIAMFGGSAVHVSVKYYVENGLTPVGEGRNSTHIWFENQTGTKFGLSWATISAGHEDFFIIELFTEGSNTFLFVFGIDWRGTWAGGIYFKEVMLESLSSYKGQYYIFHWVDDSGQDSIPQSSEIVMVSSG